MLFLLRVIFIALLMIFTTLLFPDFMVGGKYQILFTSTVTTFLTQIIRMVLRDRLVFRERGWVCGSGILGGLFISKALFTGVRITVMGILVSYFAVSLMEMLLPDESEHVLFK